jgi:hypothetical protein
VWKQFSVAVRAAVLAHRGIRPGNGGPAVSVEHGGNDGGARRLRRPGWKDPRLILGVLLVAASVAGVVGLVSSLDKTVPVWVAKEDISLGETLEHSRLEVADVRLDAVGDKYLAADAEIEPGTMANSLIRAGELVPVRALGLSGDSRRKPVTVELEQSLPDAVVAGRRVDVWAAARVPASNSYATPELLLPAAEVSAVRTIDTGFGGTGGTVLELLVDDGRLSPLLGAMANESRLTVVYNPTGDTP